MKIFLTVLILSIALLGLSIGLDEGAVKIQDEAFERAIISFGLAKGLNGVISLIQGTELSVTPLGMGLNLSVGEILDPFNDMVERFSWVMLLASVSLGIQKILLLLSSKIFLQVALALSGLIAITLIWIKKVQSEMFLSISLKVFILLLLLRFSAVIFVYTSEYFYNSMLQDEYVSSSNVIELTKGKLENIQTKNNNLIQSKEESSLFDSVNSKYKTMIENLNISKQLSSLDENIEEASTNIINLITIFFVQTILMPLLFLWILINSMRFVIKIDKIKISV